MSTVNIQLRRKGILTLPVSLRRKYNLDENELKPYLSLDNAKEGVFMVSKKLFDVELFKIEDDIVVAVGKNTIQG